MKTPEPRGTDDRARGAVLMTMHRLSLGGADRVALFIANALVEAGFVVRLALLRGDGEGETALRKLLDPRVAVDVVGPPLRSRHLELIRGYRWLRREIVRRRPNAVFASSNNMGLVTGLAARSVPSVAPRLLMKFTNPVVRPCDRGVLRRAYRWALYRFVLGRYDRVLTISDAERATLNAFYPALSPRFATVANPYVTERMLRDPPARPPDTRPKIVTVARMMPQKRLDRLLDAFVDDRLAHADLVILGDGPLHASLERRARDLGIAGRVTMPGFVEDVVPWLRGAAVFALSSDYEGYPAVVFEALACGVPVVTTDCFAGAPALLASLPGCAVVTRGDVPAFASALAAALAGPADPMPLRAVALPFAFGYALDAHVQAVDALLAT